MLLAGFLSFFCLQAFPFDKIVILAIFAILAESVTAKISIE